MVSDEKCFLQRRKQFAKSFFTNIQTYNKRNSYVDQQIKNMSAALPPPPPKKM